MRPRGGPTSDKGSYLAEWTINPALYYETSYGTRSTDRLGLLRAPCATPQPLARWVKCPRFSSYVVARAGTAFSRGCEAAARLASYSAGGW